MHNLKPALISAVGQGNTIDVFAASLLSDLGDGFIATMHFENGVPMGGWSFVGLGLGIPSSAPAALPLNIPSDIPVFALQAGNIVQSWYPPGQLLIPHSTSGPVAE
jgi:hypothetical protein